MPAASPSPKNQPLLDAGVLEPSAEGPADMAASTAPALARGRQAPAKPRKAWVDHPVSVRLIMALALPMLLDQVLSATIGFTDTIVAGHTVSPGHAGSPDDARAASAAAVGVMTYLQFFTGLMTSTLSVGATAIVARAIGARRPRLANRVAGTACAAAFLAGIAIAVLFYACADLFARAFQLHGDAATYAVQYLRIMCWTICFQTAAQIGISCLRGAGDALRPMLVTAGSTLINGIASPALSFGWFGLPVMGVRGNATGTLLAYAAAGIVTFGFLIYGDAGLKLRLNHLKIVPHLLLRVARIGVPSWLEGMILWGGQLAVVMLVMGQVDAALSAIAHAAGRPDVASGTTLAAHNATLRIESLAFLPGFGFGTAAAALVGQYLGAGKPEQARRSGIICSRLALVTMSIAAVPMVLISHLLLDVMVDSRAVVDLGWLPLIIAGLAQPGFAIAIVKSWALKGAGDTVSPLWTSLLGMGGRVLVVLAMMAYLAKIHHEEWGLNVVWTCIFLDLLFRGIAMEWVFRRGKWKLQKV